MGTLLLGQIKKQASSFLQEKYKIARLALTDVTEAELLTEEVTNDDPCSPDTRNMTKIAAATFDVGDYWRIVDVLHRKFSNEEWEMKWRQSYKALVLLEFLLTHGPEDLAEEFLYDLDAIRELSTFQYIDHKGFDWGDHVQRRADHVQNLLLGREELKQARLEAQKITREIKGFGNTNHSSPSPPSSSSSNLSPISANSKISSSFDSFSSSSSDCDDPDKQSESRVWEFDSLIEDDGDGDGDGEETGKDGLIGGICSKLVGFSPLKRLHGGPATAGFRTFSNTQRVSTKSYHRQYSLGY